MGVILWNICKIIGLLLFIIFIFLFLMIVLVLFSPICYDVAGNDTEGINGKFDVKWILGVIHAYGVYNKGEMKFSLKLFGYCIYGADKRRKKEKDIMLSVRRKQEAPQKEEYEIQKQEQPEQRQPEQQKEQKQEQNKKRQPKKKSKEQIKKKKEKRKKKEKKRKEPKKQVEEKYKKLITYIFQHKTELLKGITLFCKRMLKGIFPKHCCLEATIGMGDPALTGYLLGIAGVAKMKFEKLQIVGDFTQKIIKDVFLEIKGRIILGYLFYAVIRLLLIKPVRESIMIVWKGHGDNNG